ncbi:MAG: MarR family winged helix-turn-helix transcriptional regulator [Asticcacaulis sp.]|uniref:MarR family winged helix-turn-helix transcriptional regulator n=1 Tax=Asticcacaulis sp. TaxID=1872648 RepID=UPI003F7C72DE
MPESVSDLSAHLGYWLRYVSNHVSQAFARKVEARGVTVAEWVVLRELYNTDDAAPVRIAEQIGMTRGAITKLADRLLAKGLIERRDNPKDGRSQLLNLSDEGRALVPELACLADQNDAEFFDHLSPDERAAIERVLRGVVERRRLSGVPID